MKTTDEQLDVGRIYRQAIRATSGRGRMVDHPWLKMVERTEMTEEELPGTTSAQRVELLRAARNVAPLCRELRRLRAELKRRLDGEPR